MFKATELQVCVSRLMMPAVYACVISVMLHYLDVTKRHVTG